MSNPYFRVEDEWVICTAPYMEAYIPEALFNLEDDADEKKSTVAYVYGEGFVVLGVFNIRVFNDEDEDPDRIPVRTFIYPNMIATYPSDYDIRTLSINGKEPEKYYVMKYYPGDRIMPMRTQESPDNCTRFLTVLLSGKLPETIPAYQISQIWKENFEINGYDPEIPPSTMEACVSVLCRYNKDLNIPFRKIIGQKNSKATEYDYFIANIRQVTALTNAMSALTFEDVGFMTAAVINMTRKGIQQNTSSFEDILRV